LDAILKQSHFNQNDPPAYSININQNQYNYISQLHPMLHLSTEKKKPLYLHKNISSFWHNLLTLKPL